MRRTFHFWSIVQDTGVGLLARFVNGKPGFLHNFRGGRGVRFGRRCVFVGKLKTLLSNQFPSCVLYVLYIIARVLFLSSTVFVFRSTVRVLMILYHLVHYFVPEVWEMLSLSCRVQQQVAVQNEARNDRAPTYRTLRIAAAFFFMVFASI